MIRALAVLLLALLVAGCTALKLTYNNLDWIAEWQLGKFVDLEPRQKALFDDRFRSFWSWHRGTQLTLYVQDLRDLGGLAERPLTAEQVDRWMRRGQEHMARSMQGAVPDLTRLLVTFDDSQVQELLDNLAERRGKSLEESQDLTHEELLERAEEQMVRNLKRWIGALTREQKRRVRDWTHERQYAGTIWHQYQEAWAAAFTEVLRHRREPDFEERLRAFFDGGKVPYRDEMEKVRVHNRAVLVGLLADLSAMLTPQQRQIFRQRVNDLARDLEDLRADESQAALPRLIG